MIILIKISKAKQGILEGTIQNCQILALGLIVTIWKGQGIT